MTHQDSYKTRSQNVRQSARAKLLEMRQARLEKRAEVMAASADQAASAPSLTAPPPDPKPKTKAKTKRKPAKKTAKAKVPAADVTVAAEQVPPAAALSGREPSAADLADADLADALDDVAAKNAAMAELSDGDDIALPPQADAAASNIDTDIAPDDVSEETAAAEPVAQDVPLDAEPTEDAVIETTLTQEASQDVPTTDEAAPQEAALEEPLLAASDDDDTIPAVAASDLAKLPGAGHGLIWMLEQCGINSLQDLADSDAEILTPQLGVVGQILNVDSWISFARDEVNAPAS